MTASSPIPDRRPHQNSLLAGLPRADRERFTRGCEEVQLEFGAVVVNAGEPCSHVYLPTEGFISLVATLDDGSRLEVGVIGDEGMLGSSLILGVDLSPLHAVVQGTGASLRMGARDFRREMAGSLPLRKVMNRYVYVSLNQLAQIALCTRYHTVDERLSRWLLMTRDRAHSSAFRLTHEFMAYMLGVRREGVTKAAGSLEAQGIIRYSRGRIRIIDERRLLEASCQCYRRSMEMYQQVLAPRSSARGRRQAGR